MPARAEVYAAIDAERHYQDNLPPTRASKAIKSVAEELLLIDHYVGLAKAAWANNPGATQALEQIRKIAGITVRCMENHGAPKRRID